MRLNLYKVGDIIHTRESTNPSNRYVGTWELIGQGKVMVGVDPNDADFNTVGKTGGEKTHKLTVSEIPKHKHGIIWNTSGPHAAHTLIDGGADAWIQTQETAAAGGDQPHNNVQPYETCYIWCRTA